MLTSLTALLLLGSIVIGAGIAGIVSAIRLEKDLGLSNVLIVEKDTRFGGTWSANTYPGCACDVPTRLYSLSAFHSQLTVPVYPADL